MLLEPYTFWVAFKWHSLHHLWVNVINITLIKTFVHIQIVAWWEVGPLKKHHQQKSDLDPVFLQQKQLLSVYFHVCGQVWATSFWPHTERGDLWEILENFLFVAFPLYYHHISIPCVGLVKALYTFSGCLIQRVCLCLKCTFSLSIRVHLRACRIYECLCAFYGGVWVYSAFHLVFGCFSPKNLCSNWIHMLSQLSIGKERAGGSTQLQWNPYKINKNTAEEKIKVK